MKNLHILLLVFSLLSSTIHGQVGINTTTPKATLDIVPLSTNSSGSVIETSNSTDTKLLNVDKEGNLNFSKALKPNNIAGTVGDVLISQGPNIAPIWKKSVVDYPTIEIFSAQRNDVSSTVVQIKEHKRLEFPDINTLPITEIGTWNSTTNTFTVKKKGIYHITVGFEAKNLASSGSNLALFITTSSRSQTASGINYNSDGSYNYSTNTTLSIVLNVGNIIYITANSGGSTWQQGPSFISILYSEIPE